VGLGQNDEMDNIERGFYNSGFSFCLGEGKKKGG
jgi:hypothetical protein